MSDSLLSRLTGEQHRQVEANQRKARSALEEFRSATEAAGCPLPSLAVDSPSVVTGLVLVLLGGALPDVITRLAKVIRAGVAALAAEEGAAQAAEDGPAGSVSLMWTPYDGQLVLDCERDQVGVFQRAEGARFVLAPVVVGSGCDWLADPLKVRAADANDRVRAEASVLNANSKKRVG
ncbi:hypothetical protein CFP65_3308 [Kitasatospora sp. MMS16-BH015]|uniref:hypothetical protein n=1 Tax=Kitasatospora sp. MMS16-BH015 TaxID=2018025 RepID=UPI000CA39901|nr:hypothetical protein [Kitasatospora sp. MMS16-BH015]AUG78108.1 hypothetical protein CFP65_3308 [Kitasatospora sp. MMS16-BH015]